MPIARLLASAEGFSSAKKGFCAQSAFERYSSYLAVLAKIRDRAYRFGDAL
jgi:hypothetical protein